MEVPTLPQAQTDRLLYEGDASTTAALFAVLSIATPEGRQGKTVLNAWDRMPPVSTAVAENRGRRDARRSVLVICAPVAAMAKANRVALAARIASDVAERRSDCLSLLDA